MLVVELLVTPMGPVDGAVGAADAGVVGDAEDSAVDVGKAGIGVDSRQYQCAGPGLGDRRCGRSGLIGDRSADV